MTNENKLTLGVWVDKSVRDELKVQAHDHGLSLSKWVNHLLNQNVKQLSSKRPKVHKPFGLNAAESEFHSGKKALLIRLSHSEYEAFNKLCDFYKKSKQGLIIGILRNFMTSAAVLSSSEEEALINSNFELNKIGVNLNQIAKQLNILAQEQDHNVTYDLDSLNEKLQSLETAIKRQTEINKRFLVLCKNRTKIQID